MKATVFVGGGRITSALVAGLRLSGYTAPIVVHDRHPQKLRRLKQKYRVETELNLERAMKRAGMLVIAVRPESVKGLLEEIRNINRRLIAVSLAAGVPLRMLRGVCGPHVRWARAMPSPVARFGRGLTAIAYDRALSASARNLVCSLFRRVGSVMEVPERQFNAFTVTYSSSHGYHALAALAGAAQKIGLDRKTALLAASHALADGILSWREANASLVHLLQEAATPGGVAAAVMNAMDSAGYERVVERGLRRGLIRARSNAR